MNRDHQTIGARAIAYAIPSDYGEFLDDLAYDVRKGLGKEFPSRLWRSSKVVKANRSKKRTTMGDLGEALHYDLFDEAKMPCLSETHEYVPILLNRSPECWRVIGVPDAVHDDDVYGNVFVECKGCANGNYDQAILRAAIQAQEYAVMGGYEFSGDLAKALIYDLTTGRCKFTVDVYPDKKVSDMLRNYAIEASITNPPKKRKKESSGTPRQRKKQRFVDEQQMYSRIAARC